MKKQLIASAAALAITLSAGSALAAMDSGTADYSITLVDGCTINTTGASTDFGTYPIDSPPLTGISAGSIEVNCTNGTSYSVGVDGGLNHQAMGTPQLMSSGGDLIQYHFLANSSPLGDTGLSTIDATYTGTNMDPALPDTGTGSAVTYNLTADITLSGMEVAGTYTDTVTFTVAW